MGTQWARMGLFFVSLLDRKAVVATGWSLVIATTVLAVFAEEPAFRASGWLRGNGRRLITGTGFRVTTGVGPR